MPADEEARVRQGASATTSPDILLTLAQDPSVTVRASLAMNPALPPPVAALLAADADVRVRSILNRRLAELTPTLQGDDRHRVQRDAVTNLTALVADAALRVRISIADAVREMPDGPRDIILRLAHDPDVMVSEPVIRCSPMLTQEDLVTLIASRPPSSTIVAVASRPRIDTTVSDAIVDTNDMIAIGALLANPTARIREATLDALAAQSEEHIAWQEPLILRPHLPVRAQRMLAEIVTGHLLEKLAARRDVDPNLAQTLRAALQRPRGPAGLESQRGPAVLEGTGAPGVRKQPVAPTFRRVSGTAPAQTPVDRAPTDRAPTDWAPTDRAPTDRAPADQEKEAAVAQARALHQAGKLDDYAILDTLRRNATVSATAMLAVKAGVPVSVIERACVLRSAKAVVSLAWQAGMTAQTAVVLQSMLAGVPPDDVLRPGQAVDFPLSADEMRWQLTFLGATQDDQRAG